MRRAVCHPLREWQTALLDRLSLEPDKRSVIFVIDYKGNSGKSWFVDYYYSTHDNTLIVLPGKKPDMVHWVATCGFDPRVVFIDAPRSKQGDFIQYDFLEDLKNGRLFSGKYQSQMICFKTPHVVVMMNETPDMTKLSSDRYVNIETSNDLVLN